jgi:hypothetical protein
MYMYKMNKFLCKEMVSTSFFRTNGSYKLLMQCKSISLARHGPSFFFSFPSVLTKNRGSLESEFPIIYHHGN